ncbi:MAG: 16S rRNA (uracil(1498)-N(3))-methyltransferase [Orrella sp.]
MKTPRFFCDFELEPNTVTPLPKAVSHHVRVRRLKAGEQIILFDGSGQEFIANLTFEADGTCQASLGQGEHINRECDGHITLVQAFASQDRMDWVVEKAVELGVKSFIATPAVRSVMKLAPERAAKRLKHWEGIVQSASEQCGRNQLMTVQTADSLKHARALTGNAPKLLFTPHAKQTLGDSAVLQPVQTHGGVTLFVGPEGGWDSAELEQITQFPATSVQLGPRVLRTETAGLYATACLSTLLGW